MSGSNPPASFQILFHQRWGQLNDPHVRALAWLLDAPDLLDPLAPQWQGMIATLGDSAGSDARQWLFGLDRDPAPLHAYLGLHPLMRLGRYAEKLMAFYFGHRGILLAQGVQVRTEKHHTIGEFDFLLQDAAGLVHWEFATKFYLLESSGAGQHADYFVGPNLADTLGAKMHKILTRQLALAQHPAAQTHLPQPVVASQALLKGWLFYHENDPLPAAGLGVSPSHCRGFWCALREMDGTRALHHVVLPRLHWLAPAKVALEQAVSWEELCPRLARQFEHDTMPVMVALLEEQEGQGIEISRGFIVPDDWRNRAGQRIRHALEARA